VTPYFHFADEAAQEALTDMPPRSEEVHHMYIPISLTCIKCNDIYMYLLFSFTSKLKI
jgi:hypothetical protein